MALTSDFLVIGGGIAGISVGYELAARGSVILVEAEGALAMHSTGRSAAIYLPSYGPPEVRVLTVASRDRFRNLPGGAADPLVPRATLWLASDEPGARQLDALLAERGTGAGRLELLHAEQARMLVPFLRPEIDFRAALDAGSDDIDVAAVHQAYVRGLKARGGQIRTAAPVSEIARTGGSWQVRAGELALSAGIIVNAAGAWADSIAELAHLPQIGFEPRRRTLFTAPTAVDAHIGRESPTVSDAGEGWYLKAEGDGVLASPADADPVSAGNALPSDEGVARAIESINAVTRLGLRAVRRSWGGLRTFAPDGLPVAGAYRSEPTFAFLAGQGGYGIQMAPALAAWAATSVCGEPPPTDIALPHGVLAPERFAQRQG